MRNYPDLFTSKTDEDGNNFRFEKRLYVPGSLRLVGTDGSIVSYLPRNGVPDLIEWLQDWYDATEPPKPVLPTTGGSRIKIVYTPDYALDNPAVYDEVILVEENTGAKVWRIIKQNGRYGFYGYFGTGPNNGWVDGSEGAKQYTFEVLFDAGKEG